MMSMVRTVLMVAALGAAGGCKKEEAAKPPAPAEGKGTPAEEKAPGGQPAPGTTESRMKGGTVDKRFLDQIDKATGDEGGGGAAATEPTAKVGEPVIDPVPATGAVDFSDPVAVTTALFAAASTGATEQLASLCDPQGENDGDTRDLCAMTPSSPRFAEFREFFADGKVSGRPQIEGDRAEVPIAFGPGGREQETMKLIRRDGKWYLSGF